MSNDKGSDLFFPNEIKMKGTPVCLGVSNESLTTSRFDLLNMFSAEERQQEKKKRERVGCAVEDHFSFFSSLLFSSLALSLFFALSFRFFPPI